MFIQVTNIGGTRRIVPVIEVMQVRNDSTGLVTIGVRSPSQTSPMLTFEVTESIEQLAEMLQAVQAKPKPPELIYGRMYRVKFREQDKRNFAGMNIEDIKAKYTRDGFFLFYGDRILNQIGWIVSSFESVELLPES